MTSRNAPPNFWDMIARLQRRLTILERRPVLIPQYSSAPAAPQEGEIWTVAGKIYIRSGGITRAYSPDA